jgi:hypothetical protein
MDDFIVYTAISAGYDTLKAVPESWRGKARFVAFLEEAPLDTDHGWEIRRLSEEFDDPCRRAKRPKLLPHLYFPNAHYSLWIDGALEIRSTLPPNQWVSEYLSQHDLALFSNDYFKCIYKEAMMCRRSGLDYASVIDKQMQMYRADGYPPNNGLVDCGVLLRRHSDDNKRLNEMWYNEVMTGSRRDQLSFNYVAHKLHVGYRLLPGTYFKNAHFRWVRHIKPRLKLKREMNLGADQMETSCQKSQSLKNIYTPDKPIKVRQILNTRRRLSEMPRAEGKDNPDDAIARWGRSRLEGYCKFSNNFTQPAPLLFTQDHHPLWLGDIYRGRSAFLIAGGPSFSSLDHAKLRQPGVLTMGMNNAVKTFRPNLWVSVDSPDHFLRSIWLDPTIMKFVPICHANKPIFNSDDWQYMDICVGDCPNMVYYKRNEHFRARQFLWEDCINWGNHKIYGGGRSVMLIALRILFILGIRRVYLLGVDFKMDVKTKYHFEQNRAPGSISGNNSTYEKLIVWFRELRPLFEEQNLQVFNCNRDSNLRVFDYVPYEKACARILKEFDNVNVRAENTKGLYDTPKEDKMKGIKRA